MDLRWEAVRRVRVGPLPLSTWVFALQSGYRLQIVGPSRWRRIRLDTATFAVGWDEIEAVGLKVKELAAKRGIPVFPWQGPPPEPPASRTFGPEAPVAYIVATAVLALVLGLVLVAILTFGPQLLYLLLTALFGSLLAFLIHGILTVRRHFCAECEAMRLFFPRRGGMRCSVCGDLKSSEGGNPQP